MSNQMKLRCEYCTNNANPFKYDHMPLWFAWRPVKTDEGIAFLRKAHKRTSVGSSENFAGTYPVFWNTYHECGGQL